MTALNLAVRIAPLPLILLVAACSGSSPNAGTATTTSGATTSASTTPTAAASTPQTSASATAIQTAAGSGTPTPTNSATAGATTSPASPTATASHTGNAALQGCLNYANSHTFMEFDSGTVATDGTLTLRGHQAAMICGGPDDFHYNVNVAAPAVNVTVPAAATVKVLKNETSGIADVTIAHADFPAYLTTDHNTKVFLITGPITQITAITEQFHP